MFRHSFHAVVKRVVSDVGAFCPAVASALLQLQGQFERIHLKLVEDPNFRSGALFGFGGCLLLLHFEKTVKHFFPLGAHGKGWQQRVESRECLQFLDFGFLFEFVGDFQGKQLVVPENRFVSCGDVVV